MMPSSLCIMPSYPSNIPPPVAFSHLPLSAQAHLQLSWLEKNTRKHANKTMATALTSSEMKSVLQQIISERDQLRLELMHAKSVIVELENQNLEYDRLLSETLSELQVRKPNPTVTVAPTTSWIGTWQCSSDYPLLSPIEKAWENGWLQKALSQMPAMMNREDLGPQHVIQSRLLYSAILQSTGTNLQQALASAEEAVTIAVDLGLQELAAKGQFHRALCYHYLGEFANARWCFVLASSALTKDFRKKAEGILRELPEGHSKRSVSAGFKFYCDSKLDEFVRNV